MKKSVKKNFIYNIIYQIVILIVPLITTPYLSRVLGASGVGTYSYIYSIVTYFVLFGSLGVAMYGQREIAYLQDNVEKRSKVFIEIVLLRFVTMFISLLIYFFIFGRSGDSALFYKLFMLEIISNMFDISWFFQGMEDFKKTVIRNIIIKLIGIVGIFTLVKTSNDLWIYIVIYTLSNLFGNISLWFYLPRYIIKVKLKDINLLKHLRPTISLFIPQIAMQIYTVLDKTMIGLLLNDMNEVGYYEQSQKIVKMALAIVTAFGTVMAPRIANAVSNKKINEVKENLYSSFNVVWFLGIAITFGLIGISENLVPWFFGEGYNNVIYLIMILAPLNLAIGLNNVSGVQYLIQVKKQNIFSYTVIAGAILNFSLNLVGIKMFKAYGAAIASVLSEILILLLQLVYMKKKDNFKIFPIFKMSLKYLISGIIMFIVVFILGKYLSSNMLSTAIQIVVGGITYIIMLLLIKDEFVRKILNQIIKKIKH